MHRLAAALAALTASPLTVAVGRGGGLRRHEDHGKLDPALVYDAMADLGLTTNVMSVTWDPFDPTAPPDDMPAVLAALEAAKARDIGLTLAVYQGKARGITDTPSGARLLAAWVQDVPRATARARRSST